MDFDVSRKQKKAMSQEPVHEVVRLPTLHQSKRGKSDGSPQKRPLVAGILEDELFHNSPYKKDLIKSTKGFRSRRQDRQDIRPWMQKSDSEPALRSNRGAPPAQHVSLQKDGAQAVGKAAQGSMKRSASQPRRPPHHLPALQDADKGGTFPGRGSPGSLESQRQTDDSPGSKRSVMSPMSQTWPQGTGKPKRPAQALQTISTTANTITRDLDKTMNKLLGFQEGTWANATLSNVQEGEDNPELYSQIGIGISGRLSVNLSATGGSLSQESAMERQSSGQSRKSVSGTVEIEEIEEPQGLDEEKMRRAFLNYVEPGTFDLSIQSLIELLKYCGHPVVATTGDAVQELVKEVTSYEYLDFDEFISFMERYTQWEKDNFHDIFMEFDEDGSGELDIYELRLLIKEVGIMSLAGMFQEAISLVDVDNNGTLDFDEFLKFLRIYQRNEGFTTEEVGELLENMATIRVAENVGKECPQDGLPVDFLPDLLVRFFGMHIKEDANQLQKKIVERHMLHNPHSSPHYNLGLKDVLLHGRQIREKYYDDLKKPNISGDAKDMANKRQSLLILHSNFSEMQQFDKNGDMKISFKELKDALKTMQYEAMSRVIFEILNEVLPEEYVPGQELEFDEFFDFLLIYRQREGFLKKEVVELKGIFHTFDEDRSGDVSTLELGDVFRYMGYSPSVDDLKRWILVVDEDRTNELNFREFLRLMQIHRAGEIRRIRGCFEKFWDKATQKCTRGQLLPALASTGHKDIPKEVAKKLPNDGLDFERFLLLVEECHSIKVFDHRKKAGFSDTEIDNVLELFRRFDKDGGGELDCTELQGVFAAFGWAPKNQEEQEEIFGRLDRARSLAREAGVEHVTPDGSGEIREWEFVQLARMIRRQQETAEEREMVKLAHDLKFTMPEVNEFYEVFQHWVKIEEGSDAESDDEDGGSEPKVLSRDTVRRLVRAMGVRFTPESKEKLDKKLEDLTAATGTVTIDFKNFLRLMRWILDIDFGNINEKLNEKAEGSKKK
mmetsp:Transcript_27085/g.46974  ORF Transcript_27085/g.46974 Transcript_27085/m.46974 type:complete len:1007 (+) Transcript_27085:35-3055(+)